MTPLITAAKTALRPQLRAWRGEAGLAEVFWWQGVFTSLVLGLAFAASLLNGTRELSRGLLLLFVGYSGWAVVAIWRCAERRAPSEASVLAQALAIAWAVNTLLVGGSLAVMLR